MAPPTTALILAHRALNRQCGQDCVDWAECLLMAGFDTARLRQLAGMAPPFNHFEIAALRDAALSELGVGELSRADGLRVLAAEILRPVLESGSDIGKAVSAVRDLCIEEDNATELMDFYLLAFAEEDLKAYGDQHYWDGATSSNILPLMRERSWTLVRQIDETPNQPLRPTSGGAIGPEASNAPARD